MKSILLALACLLAAHSLASLHGADAISFSDMSRQTYKWDKLAIGKPVYADRDYVYKVVPEAFVGCDYLQSRGDDKTKSEAGWVSFTMSRAATVYVAFDDRLTTKPQWLSTFTETADKLVFKDTSENRINLIIYRKDFPAGEVSLGGNGGGDDCANYVVLVK